MRTLTALILAGVIGLAASAPALADQKAQDLFKKVTVASLAVRSLTADFFVTDTTNGATTHLVGKLTLMKPAYLRMDCWPADAQGRIKPHSPNAPHQILAADGTTYWEVAADGTAYKLPASPSNIGSDTDINKGANDPAGFASMFFDKSDTGPDSMPPSVRYAGTQVVNGVTCQVLRDDEEAPDSSGSIHFSLFIGPDYLIRGGGFDGGHMGKLSVELHNVRTGVHLAKSDFAFTPPSWAKPTKTPATAPDQPSGDQPGAPAAAAP